MNRVVRVLCLGLFLNFSVALIKAEGEDMVIENGRKVSFDYVLTIDGEVVDSSERGGSLQYTHGVGRIISGLEKKLEGLHVGDEKTITVPPEEAYGQIDPKVFQEVSRSSLPENIDPQVGMPLQVQGSNGQLLRVTITEVKEESVVIDFNHPLAGKTLDFQVKVISIE